MNLFKRFFKTKKVEIEIDKRTLLSHLPFDAVIIEAGVCDGKDTEEFAQVFPSGKIHGFECLPHYQRVAKQRLEKYQNVTLYPFALNDKSCELDFYISTREGEFSGSGSLLSPKLHKQVHPEVLFENKIKVQAITIDEWVTRFNIPRVDFLWLDLQGAEIRALQGAEKTLDRVKGIFTEVSLMETYEGVPLYDEVKAFLASRGFVISKEFLPYRDMGNVLFLKK